MAKAHRSGKWSADVTARSNALDLEPNVFEKESAQEIARSLKRSRREERSSEVERLPVGHVGVHVFRGALYERVARCFSRHERISGPAAAKNACDQRSALARSRW